MHAEVADQSLPTPMPGVGPHGVPDADDPAPPESTIDEVDRLLDEVEAALARLDDGTYGTCACCGAAIDDARLTLEPTARTCGACATAASDGLGPTAGAPADEPASGSGQAETPLPGASSVSGGPED